MRQNKKEHHDHPFLYDPSPHHHHNHLLIDQLTDGATIEYTGRQVNSVHHLQIIREKVKVKKINIFK